MNKTSFLLTIIGILFGFTIGFLFANSINRSEIERLKNEIINKPVEIKPNENVELTDEQITGAIAKADNEPNNLDLQKNLGLNLYRYANLKQNFKLLPEAARLMKNAYKEDTKDFDLIVSLGNVFFDLSQITKDNEKLLESRLYYEKSLKIKPDDVDVRTDLGLTYFLANPPQNEKAIAEFRKSLQSNPKHEKTLQSLVSAMISERKFDDAEKFLANLREINPNNQNISDLQTQLTEGRNTK